MPLKGFRLEVAFYRNYDFGNEPGSGTAVIKKISLICISLFAPLTAMPGLSNAQFVLPTPPEHPQRQEEAAPAIPDDLRLILMIRNVVVALNQANTTGNYTVLREMGTANFQMTNSSARLAEIFAALRSRKIDLSPVMVFNPKLTSAPALEDGQVLRLAGYFPTSPEQVQFDLAYQRSAEQWLLAGIAINVAPLSEDGQASAAPAGQFDQANAEPGPAGKPGEAKPIRIDLSQPAPAQAKPGAPKKPAAVKKPKTPAGSSQKTAAAQSPAAPQTPAAAPAPQAAAPAAKSGEPSIGWMPFGR